MSAKSSWLPARTNRVSWPRWSISTDGAVYVGPLPPNRPHAHRAHQLIVSLAGRVEVVANGTVTSGKGILVPSQVEHSVRPTAWTSVVAFFEPLFFEFDPKEQAYSSVREVTVEERDFSPDVVDNPLLFDAARILAGLKRLQNPLTEICDSRIADIIKQIDESKGERVLLEAFTKQYSTSTSRLTHLFSKEVGTPFRSYLLWIKLRHAIELITQGQSLTNAAHYAGFSDSAHFSRTFHDTFGFRPSYLRFFVSM